ncbi:hypothetical protein KJ830_07625 [bacterium]|nr:hypothetical protein [bacterium]MBU4510898.1 hypothetical protein [bacterium]
MTELELAIGGPDTGLSKDIPLTPALGLIWVALRLNEWSRLPSMAM